MSLSPVQNPEIDHNKSITQLTVTKNGFLQFGEIWLDHLKNVNWADYEALKGHLNRGEILIPVHMIALKRVGGKKSLETFSLNVSFRKNHVSSGEKWQRQPHA